MKGTQEDGHGTILTTYGDPFLTLDVQAWQDEYGDSLGFMFTQLEDTDKRVHGTPQYTMRTGLKLFGNRGLQAIRSEMQQFHDLSVIEPVKPSDLTPTDRDRVLEYLMFLKEKRSGKVKGRGCADGRKQRLWTDRADSTSPTVSLTSLFVTGTIDAKERRCVAIVDVPGAFLQTDRSRSCGQRLQ